jgi:hypothetical protein
MQNKNFMVALSTLLSFLNFVANAQEVITVAPPIRQQIPAAFAREREEPVYFRITDDGQYALASTVREAKAWKMPTGELVYSFQSGSLPGDRNGVYSQQLKNIFVTQDSKYMYPTEYPWKGRALTAISLPSGKTVPDGPLLDSLKNGNYEKKFDKSEYPDYKEQDAIFAIKRDFNNGGKAEGIKTIGKVSDLSHPGETIVYFKQQYCGSKDWIKSSTNYKVSELRDLQKKNNHCQFYDNHMARYNPATKKAVYIGKLLEGVEKIEYSRISEATVSPFGEVVHFFISKKYPIGGDTFFSLEGKELWNLDFENNEGEWKGFDNNGNAIFTKLSSNGQVVMSVHEPLTGVVIKNYELPVDFPKLKLIPQWNMYADVQRTDDVTYSIGIHDMKTGKLIIALSDKVGTDAFSKRYNAEANALQAQMQANIRANQESWDNHIRQESERAAEQREKAIAAATEHAKHFMTCPKCKGVGYFGESGYSTGSTKTTDGGTVRNTITGEISNRTTTTTTAAGTYSNYWACSQCQGRREVPRY